MPTNRIPFLLAQLTDNNLTRTEREELDALILDPSLKDIFTESLKTGFEKGYLTPEWDAKKLDQMVQAVLSSDKTGGPVGITRKMISIRRWAAAILILLGTGTYFFLKSPQKEIVKEKPITQDVAPGGNKAILTLSNGSKLVLDSANIGVIGKQGNTKILKTDSGKLDYQASKSNDEALTYNTLSTPRGGQYQLVLPDGTKVWLNAASSITYPTAFSGKERNVRMTGEAYFEVTKDAARPFHVKLNETEVAVLGTHFNINGYADELDNKVTLLEGSVRVGVSKNEMTIKPGEQAIIQKGQIKIQKDVNLNEVIAWKDGSFDFESAELPTILRQFARWYDVEVEYQGPVSNRKFFAIVSRNTSLKNVLELLQDNNIHYEINGKKLMIKTQ